MYESHITVTNIKDEEFKSVCQTLQVKPVIIEEDTGSGVRQTMTARFHKTHDEKQAFDEMNELASHFGNRVIRRKLEKIVGKGEMPPHLYLEFHLKYEVPKNRVKEFVNKVSVLGGHTSQNIIKQANGENVFQFATAREPEVYHRLRDELQEFNRINVIRECVVFDDNPNIDSGWAECKECIIKQIG
ncbi:MAG: hypothetical protein DWQ19_12175 [Crenarchaeota archaeon]|nr:MAG: hypothetical protein DWQ19_12175 [Thermoproteota archaeon]